MRTGPRSLFPAAWRDPPALPRRAESRDRRGGRASRGSVGSLRDQAWGEPDRRRGEAPPCHEEPDGERRDGASPRCVGGNLRNVVGGIYETRRRYGSSAYGPEAIGWHRLIRSLRAPRSPRKRPLDACALAGSTPVRLSKQKSSPLWEAHLRWCPRPRSRRTPRGLNLGSIQTPKPFLGGLRTGRT